MPRFILSLRRPLAFSPHTATLMPAGGMSERNGDSAGRARRRPFSERAAHARGPATLAAVVYEEKKNGSRRLMPGRRKNMPTGARQGRSIDDPCGAARRRLLADQRTSEP